MARPSNTEERRAQIVVGMRKVLAEQGYAGASTADIARAAGLSAGLVHYHFETKRDVLLALVDDLALRLRTRAAEKARAHGGADPNARAKLHGFIDAAVGLGAGADAQAVACWIGISAESVRDSEVRDVTAKVTRALVDEFATLARVALMDSERDPKDARKIAALLWSAMQGSYLLAVTSPGAVPKGSMAPMLHALADDLLGAAAPARELEATDTRRKR